MVPAINSNSFRESQPILKRADSLAGLTLPIFGLINSYLGKTDERSFLIINKKIARASSLIKNYTQLHLMLSLGREIIKISLTLDKDFIGSALDQEIKKLLPYFIKLRNQGKPLCGNEYRQLLYIFFNTTNEEHKSLSKIGLRPDIEVILEKSCYIESIGVNGIINEVDSVLRSSSKNLLLEDNQISNSLLLAKLITCEKEKAEHSIFFAEESYFDEALELAKSIENEIYRNKTIEEIERLKAKESSCCIIL